MNNQQKNVFTLKEMLELNIFAFKLPFIWLRRLIKQRVKW